MPSRFPANSSVSSATHIHFQRKITIQQPTMVRGHRGCRTHSPGRRALIYRRSFRWCGRSSLRTSTLCIKPWIRSPSATILCRSGRIYAPGTFRENSLSRTGRPHPWTGSISRFSCLSMRSGPITSMNPIWTESVPNRCISGPVNSIKKPSTDRN